MADSSSLVQFANRGGRDRSDRGKLFYGREQDDGAPFRGHVPPLLTNEEAEDRLVPVTDACNDTFRTWIKEENKAYLEVLDEILNGKSQCLFIDRQRVKIKRGSKVSHGYKIYIEWARKFREDRFASQAGYEQQVELSHGQANSPFYPF